MWLIIRDETTKTLIFGSDIEKMAGVLSTPFKQASLLNRTLTRLSHASASFYHYSPLQQNTFPTVSPLSRPLTIDETASLLGAFSRRPALLSTYVRSFKTRSTTGIGKTSSTGNEAESKTSLYVTIYRSARNWMRGGAKQGNPHLQPKRLDQRCSYLAQIQIMEIH